MCLAIPGRIMSLKGEIAEVDYGGMKTDANVELVDVKEGEWVIVHAGFAIQVLNEEEAKKTREELRSIYEAWHSQG